MAKKKQLPMQPAPLFENYEDDPRYRWYVNELYDLSFTLDMYESAYKDSTRELINRAKCIELKRVIDGQLRTYLQDKYGFSWEQVSRIVDSIEAMVAHLHSDTDVDPVVPKEVPHA